MGSDESVDRTESTLENVGRCLLIARQEAGLSVVQLADSLHMGHEQLDALEKGDRSRLPEPVFIKAMTRRVAAKLQIDSDPLIRDLSIALNERHAVSGKKESADTQRATSERSRVVKIGSTLGLLAVISVVGAVLLLVIKQRQSALPSMASVNGSTPPLSAPEAEMSTEQTPLEVGASEPPAFTITSMEPSWLEIRNAQRETVYMGTLETEKVLTVNPGDEIYAGRPDLVLFSSEGNTPTPLSDISDVRWHTVTPEP